MLPHTKGENWKDKEQMTDAKLSEKSKQNLIVVVVVVVIIIIIVFF